MQGRESFIIWRATLNRRPTLILLYANNRAPFISLLEQRNEAYIGKPENIYNVVINIPRWPSETRQPKTTCHGSPCCWTITMPPSPCAVAAIAGEHDPKAQSF